MTITTSSHLTIASGVGEVWAYFCDVERWAEWAPTVRECRVHGGGPLRSGARVDQRAKVLRWWSRSRSQQVTTIEAPHRAAFAGPMGTSDARWGMDLVALDDHRTAATMWIEVTLAGPMRAIPARMLRNRIQRVSDREMALIKAAVELGASPRAARGEEP